ncbi:MAG: hypothetical protein IKV26_03915 [Paludibacteraceae bacterium]|nr:hypothetical protein [Paludibacteraceae bacterium]
MTTEEIKNECIRRGEYTIGVFESGRANALIFVYLLGLAFLFLSLIWFFTPNIKGIFGDSKVFNIILFVFVILGVAIFFMIRQLRNLLIRKNDTVTFDKCGISYNGSNERLSERLFNLKWSEISNIDIEELQGHRQILFNYVIHTETEKEYRINNLTEGRDFALNDFMWLTNYFSGKEVFDAEKMNNFSKEAQPSISLFSILLCLISCFLNGFVVMFNLEEMETIVVPFGNKAHIFIPLVFIGSIILSVLEFIIKRRKDSRYKLLSLCSGLSFVFCFISLFLLIFSSCVLF